MSSIEITSDVFKIESDIDSVFSFLSDFNKMGRMFNMAKQMGAGTQMIDSGRMAELSEKIEDIRFMEEECIISLKGMGDLAIRMVEKEYPKLVKLESGGTIPFTMTTWIQLLEDSPYVTRMRITFHSEMNMMLKMMLKGKLEKAIQQFGEMLAKLPYAMLKNM